MGSSSSSPAQGQTNNRKNVQKKNITSPRKPTTAGSQNKPKNGERMKTAPPAPKQNKYKTVEELPSKRKIRDRLRAAILGDDVKELQDSVEAFNENKLDDVGELKEATERLEFLKLRKEIADACVRRNAQVLTDTIRKVQASKFRSHLKPYVDRAQYIVQDLGTSSQYKHSIPGISTKTVSEIRRLHHPPPGVHETMIATYVLLGYPENKLKDWSFITAQMGQHGKTSLESQIAAADSKPVNREASAVAKQYLGTLPLDFVRQKSTGAAAFYVWASRKVGMANR